MPSDITRAEFQQLAARVSVLESEVEGEKVVSRYILEQTRRNGDDLAATRSRLDRVENEIRGLRADLSTLSAKVDGLITALPGIVAETMRAVLRERDGG